MFLSGIRGAEVFKSRESRKIRTNLAFESRAIYHKKGTIRHQKIAKGASKDIAC